MPARPIRHRRGRPPKPKLSTCRALVWVDSSKLRRKALADWRRSQTTFQKAEAELTVYAEKDEPAYHQWFHSHFGPKIKEVEHLQKSLDEVRERWQRLMRIQEEHRCSPKEAESIAREEDVAQEREEAADPAEKEEARRKMDEELKERKRVAFLELEEELLILLRQARGSIREFLRSGGARSELLAEIVDSLSSLVCVPEFIVYEFLMQPRIRDILRGFGLGEDAAAEKKSAAPVDDVGARIKQLARELAFALHPDQSGDDDPKKIELWHEVQAAVKAKDLDRLEVLHAHMQAMDGEFSAGTPLSRILGVIQMFRESREALRRRIRELRATPAWGFSALPPDKKEILQRRHAAKLDAEIRQGQETLAALERDFLRWQRSRTRPQPTFLRLEDLFF